jgi:hypothetical protein
LNEYETWSLAVTEMYRSRVIEQNAEISMLILKKEEGKKDVRGA